MKNKANPMVDSILWKEESDRYTERAIQAGVDFFSAEKLHGDDEYLLDIFNRAYHLADRRPREVLDVGCCAGGTLIKIAQKFQDLQLYGIDPGENTIELFNKRNSEASNIHLQVGYAHELPYPDDSFDILIFSCVLQWIPRRYLLRSLAEVDRVLRTNGLVVIQEYLPFKPTTSISKHDSGIRIFKEDYPALFAAIPWFREELRTVTHQAKGEYYRKVFSVVRKVPLTDAYSDVV